LTPDAPPAPKILVVDDDAIMVSLLHTLLQLDGFQVVGAHPGESIADRARETQPDLILLDVFLRGADGLDQLSRLKAEADLKAIPVVMCSGMDVGDQCAARGAAAFLIKPYSPDHLLETIRACLGPRPEADGPGTPKGQTQREQTK
jgi:two-component system cell cycle response regulator DivK